MEFEKKNILLILLFATNRVLGLYMEWRNVFKNDSFNECVVKSNH